MPDSQFATNVRPLETSFATATRDALLAPQTKQPGVSRPLNAPELLDSESLVRQQEQLIQRAYNQAHAQETVHSSAAGDTFYTIAKRALDISAALPALLLFAPLMLILAVMIRLDSPGPTIFKQQRVGKNGRLFCMYKFRSMTVNAGVLLNGVHKSESDSRITKVGQFIRKTSLDELPQLVNVLLGQMSLVGPRPELPEIVLQRYEPWQYRRLDVPQGITGWWQVTGRGKKLLWKHTADDLYYVDRASFWFDLKLLFMTVRAVLGRNGAF